MSTSTKFLPVYSYVYRSVCCLHGLRLQTVGSCHEASGKLDLLYEWVLSTADPPLQASLLAVFEWGLKPRKTGDCLHIFDSVDCVCMCVCVYAHECRCPQRSEESYPPRTGVAGNCDPPNVDSRPD